MAALWPGKEAPQGPSVLTDAVTFRLLLRSHVDDALRLGLLGFLESEAAELRILGKTSFVAPPSASGQHEEIAARCDVCTRSGARLPLPVVGTQADLHASDEALSSVLSQGLLKSLGLPTPQSQSQFPLGPHELTLTELPRSFTTTPLGARAHPLWATVGPTGPGSGSTGAQWAPVAVGSTGPGSGVTPLPGLTGGPPGCDGNGSDVARDSTGESGARGQIQEGAGGAAPGGAAPGGAPGSDAPPAGADEAASSASLSRHRQPLCCTARRLLPEVALVEADVSAPSWAQHTLCQLSCSGGPAARLAKLGVVGISGRLLSFEALCQPSQHKGSSTSSTAPRAASSFTRPQEEAAAQCDVLEPSVGPCVPPREGVAGPGALPGGSDNMVDNMEDKDAAPLLLEGQDEEARGWSLPPASRKRQRTTGLGGGDMLKLVQAHANAAMRPIPQTCRRKVHRDFAERE